MHTPPARRPRYVGLLVVIGLLILFVGMIGLFVSIALGRGASAPAASAPDNSAPTAPTASPGKIWGKPAAHITDSSEVAYRAWMIALLTYDTPAALALYRPAGESDPAADVEAYFAELRALFPGPGASAGPLGEWRDVHEAGEYTNLAEPGLRYALTQIVFAEGEVCVQGALVEDGGWHVRAWGTITAEECRAALSAIADSR